MDEALPGVLRNRGTRPFVSGEQKNKCLISRGTGEQEQHWGSGNIENENFDFGEGKRYSPGRALWVL